MEYLVFGDLWRRRGQYNSRASVHKPLPVEKVKKKKKKNPRKTHTDDAVVRLHVRKTVLSQRRSSLIYVVVFTGSRNVSGGWYTERSGRTDSRRHSFRRYALSRNNLCPGRFPPRTRQISPDLWPRSRFIRQLYANKNDKNRSTPVAPS